MHMPDHPMAHNARLYAGKALWAVQGSNILRATCADSITMWLTSQSCVQAGHCGRCRAELGLQGSVCQHCHLDDLFLAWEVRLYSLQTRAAAAGGFVTAEDALRQVCFLTAVQ